ncbi:DUF2125 domain-containing protein [Stappia sp. MMSF_3263]|uniref:DUF2125 domain-containing protein n=1 Tax=Stappia sp. MMSF_3263 TaxID=3046693 RepID=UPI00273DF629|nr:DUF2125 domain-containing protein [Stappia sp. MMSF_3263]
MPDTPASTESAAPQAPRRKGSRRGYIWLIALVVLGIALWSAYWTVARGMAVDVLRNVTEAARIEGGEIACGGQRLGGFPFHLQLDCAPLSLRSPRGESAGFDAFRAVALAYNPWHVILEAESPAAMEFAPASRLAGTWETARASFRVGTSSVERADIELTAPDLALALPGLDAELAASSASLHLRQTPQRVSDADIAVALSGAALPGAALVLDARASLTLKGGAVLLSGRGADLIALLKNEEAVEVSEVRVSSGEVTVAAAGTLWIDPAGRLNGSLPLTIAGADKLPALLAPYFPEGSNVPASLAGAVMGFGKPAELDGAPAVTVPLAFDAGNARIGIIPLGAVPPLR